MSGGATGGVNVHRREQAEIEMGHDGHGVGDEGSFRAA